MQGFNLFYGMAAKEPKPKAQNFDDKTRQQLGQRIKTLRIARGHHNYEKFAFEHNISRSQYWRYEQGEDLKFSSLVRIVKAFDMTLADFFSEGFN